MNYHDCKMDEEATLKSFASMIRYSCNNLGGKFVLSRAACALGVTEEIIETLLGIFSDCGMIKIVSAEEEFYMIESVGSVELSKAMHTAKYAELVELLNTVNDYKSKFMKMDLSS
jgi:hypothetical protein